MLVPGPSSWSGTGAASTQSLGEGEPPVKKLVLGILCALFALACVAMRVQAAVVVDPNGGGDYTSIQAALDAVAASFPPETVIVLAGAYAESVTLPQRDSQSLIECPAGPESTSVAGLLLGPSTYGVGSAHRDWVVRGLSVAESVTSVPQKSRARFEQCAFGGGLTVNWLDGGVSMPVFDCDFGGPTKLLGIYGMAQALRFRNAPLRTEPRVGGLYYTDCSFVGAPGETLVVEADSLGYAISSGAACSSRNTEPSHVLTALDVEDEMIRGTIRISFGPQNTIESARNLAKVLRDTLKRLR